MKKIVILMHNEIPCIDTYLARKDEKGFVSITPSKLPKKDKDFIKNLAPMYDENKKEVYDEVAFTEYARKRQKKNVYDALAFNNRLIVIVEDALFPTDYTEVKKNFETTYKDEYDILEVLSSKSTDIDKETGRVIFFISGKDFAILAENLAVEPPDPPKLEKADESVEEKKGEEKEKHATVKVICKATMDEMTKEFMTDMENPHLNLIVMNSSDFDDNDTYFFTRAAATKGYAPQTIELPAEIKAPVPEKPADVAVTTTPGSNAATTKDDLREKIERLATELNLTKSIGQPFHDFAIVVLKTKLKLSKGYLGSSKKFAAKVLSAAVTAQYISKADEEKLQKNFL